MSVTAKAAQKDRVANILEAIIKHRQQQEWNCIEARHKKQPTSKNKQVHEHQLKAIVSYVTPTTSVSTKRLTFQQAPPELQAFKQEESVTNVTRGRARIISRCDESIFRQQNGPLVLTKSQLKQIKKFKDALSVLVHHKLRQLANAELQRQ